VRPPQLYPTTPGNSLKPPVIGPDKIEQMVHQVFDEMKNRGLL
jgi:hypothetical protein